MRLPGVYILKGEEAAAALAELADTGGLVFTLASDIDSPTQFFQSVIESVPLDPPLSGHVHWDALSDSLFGGLDSLAENNVALVWPDALALADSHPEAYEIAVSVLRDVAVELDRRRSPRPLASRCPVTRRGSGVACRLRGLKS